MKLGIMQPYFFPYLGYFDLINYTDRWIIFDTVQYIRHGWMNRNRVLHPNEGWQYVIVPLQKHSREEIIKSIKVAAASDWTRKILAQLAHYKKRAPYYSQTVRLVEQCLASDELSLSRLNGHILQVLCDYLQIPFRAEFFSDMAFDLDISHPGDWALKIAENLGAAEYVNLPGGRELFDPEKFSKAGIRLSIRTMPHLVYKCPDYEYIPSLSIIDVLMWNSGEEVKQYLDHWKDMAIMEPLEHEKELSTV